MSAVGRTRASSAPRVGRKAPGTTAAQLSKTQVVLVYLLPSLAALGGQLQGFGQIFAFRIAVLVYLVVTIINLGKRAAHSMNLPRYILVMSWIWAMAILFLAVVRGLPTSGWTEAASVAFGLILLNCVFLGPLSMHTLKIWLRGWSLAVLLQVVIGFWEVITGAHMANYYLYNLNVPEWAVADSIAGSLGNPNAYAFFLVASMPLLGVSWYLAKGSNTRWIYAVLMLAAIAMLNETGSRLSWIVFGLVVAMWLFTRNAGFRAIAVFAVLVALAIVIAEPMRVSALLGLDTSNAAGIISGDASIQVRWNLLLNGLAFTAETSLLGLGPGGFATRMSGAVPYDAGGIVSTHSGAVEILAQYGVVVFLAVVVLLIWLVVAGAKGMRRSRRGSKLRELSIALVISTVALTPLSFTNSSTLNLSFVWTYLVVLCVMGAVVYQQIKDGSDEMGDDPSRSDSSDSEGSASAQRGEHL